MGLQVTSIARESSTLKGSGRSTVDEVPARLRRFVRREPWPGMATVPELAERLGISPSTAYRWIRRGKLLGWRQGRQLKGPTEQIMAPARPVPALEEISAIMDMAPVLVWDFLHRRWTWEHGPPIPPLEKLRRGQVQEVLDSAPSYGYTMG